MRLVPNYRVVNLLLTPTFLLLGIIIAIFIPQYFLLANYWQWLLVVSCLLITVTPLGNIKIAADNSISNKQPLHKHLHWLAKIIGLELLLMIIYLGINLVTNHTLIVYHSPQSGAWQHSIRELTLQYGLSPWPAYALFAVGFGYFAMNRGEQTFMSNFLNTFLNVKHQSKLASVTNALARQCQNVILSITLCFAMLMLISLLPSHMLAALHPEQISLQFALLLIIFLTLSKVFRKRLWQACQQNRPLWTILLSICVLFIVTFLIFDHATNLIINSKNPHPLALFTQHMDWQATWQLFSLCWWLGIAPLMGIVIAKISRSYSLRAIILVTIIPASIISLTISYMPPIHLNNSILIKLLCGAGFIATMLWFAQMTQKTRLPSLTMTYLAAHDSYKYRDYRLTLLRIIRVACVGLFLYLPIGILGIGLLSILFSFMACIFTLLIAFAMLRVLKTGATP